MLKFGQKEVTTEDFYGQRQVTDIFMIDVNKVVVSGRVSCNNGKDYRYIVGYQVDEALIPMFIKTHKNIFMACHNTIETLPIHCHSMSLRKKSGCLNTKRFRMRLSHSCLKNWRQKQTKEKVGTPVAS